MLEIPYPTLEVQILITPLVIQVPSPFPYESIKAIHWVYEPKAYKRGYENQPLIVNEPNVTSIVGPEGMTRSGRVFVPKVVKLLAKAKGKEVANDISIPAQSVESKEGLSSPKAVAS